MLMLSRRVGSLSSEAILPAKGWLSSNACSSLVSHQGLAASLQRLATEGYVQACDHSLRKQ